MNFNFTRFFYLSSRLITGCFIFTLGILTLLLPWSTTVKMGLIHFIETQNLILSFFGLGFILIALSIIFYTVVCSRRSTIHLLIKNQPVDIEISVVEQYMEQYWQKRFPEDLIHSVIQLKKKEILITVDLPTTADHDQDILLNEIQNDFKTLFSDLIGYPHTIHLIASFPKK